MKRSILTLGFIGAAVILFSMAGGYAFLGERLQTETGDPVAELKKLSEAGAIKPVKPRPPNPHKTIGAHSKAHPHAQLGPDKLVLVALQHLAEKRASEALKTLNDGLNRYPKSAKMLGVRGTIYLQEKKVTNALNDFEAAVALSPDDVLLLVNRAQAYRQFGREDAALKDLDKAISLKPDFVAARFNRGAIYLNRRKHEAARKEFEHCIKVDPHAPAPYFNLAIALGGLGNRDDAIAEMERFIKVAKNEKWKKVAQDQLTVWKKDDRQGKQKAAIEVKDKDVRDIEVKGRGKKKAEH